MITGLGRGDMNSNDSIRYMVLENQLLAPSLKGVIDFEAYLL